MNLRSLPRLRRRLKIRIGSLQTFTSDVTALGFSAELMQAFRPGTELQGAIELCGESFPFTGQVCWARAGEPRLNLRGRFGVRFNTISSSFDALFQTTYRLNAVPA